MNSATARILPDNPVVLETAALDCGTTAAGHDESIPRVFLALADVGVLVLAFVFAATVSPWVQWLLLPVGPLGISLPAWLSVPKEPTFGDFPPLASVLWMLLLVSPLTVIFMELLGGYRQLVDQNRSRLLASTVAAPLLALSFLALALFTLKISSSSRVFVFTFAAASTLALLTYRFGLWCYKRTRLENGSYARNVLVIGHAVVAAWVANHFNRYVPGNRFRLVGWLRAPAAEKNAYGSPSTGSPPTEVPHLGEVAILGDILIHRPIHEVIVVASSDEHGWFKDVITTCDYFRVRLRIVPELLLVESLSDLQLVFRTEQLGLPEIVLAHPHLEAEALFLKRVMDLVVSATVLVLFLPLFALIALAIKITTPHLPVFYPWRVVGLKGRQFTGYKFTTMIADADERKQDLMALNEMTGPVFKIRNDPRVTPLGRFLRTYSLNELPQLWSVLKGDMSLVGPRPAGPHELAGYELWHKRKLSVQPGVTCLWQVRGRNAISSFDDWVRMDLEYIAKWSLWLDVKILLRTVAVVLRGTGS